MIEFRDYQVDIIEKGVKILETSRFVYLAMEVRTGKTLTSLGIAEKMGVKKTPERGFRKLFPSGNAKEKQKKYF